MADDFNGGELRELAEHLDKLQGAAGGVQATDAMDPCEIYNQVRAPLKIVRDILCSPWIKRLLGPLPCEVITQVIRILDRLCPERASA